MVVRRTFIFAISLLSAPFNISPAYGAHQELGDVKAAIRVRDYAGAYALLKPLASGGDAEAQYMLSTLYRNGQGVTKSHEKAVFWLEKAANQGHVKATYNLAVMYEKGWGVDKDPVRAEELMAVAAEQGHPLAQRQMHKETSETRQKKQLKEYRAVDKEKTLRWLAQKGSNRELKQLLEQHPDINSHDDSQRTALYEAAEAGHRETVSILLQAGAQIGLEDKFGVTPVMAAAQQVMPMW